jgi:hypothetical protein
MDASSIEITRDWKSSDSILGIEWIGRFEVLCVTSRGLDVYTVKFCSMGDSRRHVAPKHFPFSMYKRKRLGP